MKPQTPTSPADLAEALATAAGSRHAIRLGGNFSKDVLGGLIADSETAISTACLRRVLQYEPRDLTISVEAGLPWTELESTLAANRQMIPLDPPWAAQSTVGGVVAANLSGPRRRLYGTARDCVIGMTFATLEGKLIKTGGMVVKNVAGLDIAKLLIGSYGTLAAIATVNFKLTPKPPRTRTFLYPCVGLPAALEQRDRILKSVLQPAAIDLLNPPAANMAGMGGYPLLIQTGGSDALIDRYTREFDGADVLDGEAEASLWQTIREFAPAYLKENKTPVLVRASCTLSDVGALMESTRGAVVMRAGSGVAVIGFPTLDKAVVWMDDASKRGWPAVIESAAMEAHEKLRWPNPRSDFPVMTRIKQLFDPHGLLNRGRLYGRI